MKRGWTKPWFGTAALLVGLGALACLLRPSSRPPQIITFPDGTQARFVTATWGTNHSQPRLLAHVIDHLPPDVADYARKKLEPRFGPLAPWTSSIPTLGLWFEPYGGKSNLISDQAFGLSCSLGDGNDAVSGTPGLGFFAGGIQTNSPLIEIATVPRRSKYLVAHIYSRLGIEPGTVRFRGAELGTVRFRNPAYGRYQQWRPDPMPLTKQAGDLIVTVFNLAVGEPKVPGYTNDLTIIPPLQPGLTFIPPLHPLRSNAVPVSFVSLKLIASDGADWLPDRFEISDPGGNQISSHHLLINPNPPPPNWVYGALWPDESAWKLTVSLKRANHFDPGDVIVFTNFPLPVPVGAAGTSQTSSVHGIPITLRNYLPGASQSSVNRNGYIRLEWPKQPNETAIDLAEVRTDSGLPLGFNGTYLGDDYAFFSITQIPGGAKFLNVTVVAQKVRSVEFLVKPPAATNWAR